MSPAEMDFPMSSADSITEHISRFVRNWLNWLPGVVLAVALDQISEALKLPIFSSDKGTEASAMVVIVSLASLSRHFRDWPLRRLISIVVIVVALVAFGWLKQTAWQEVSQRHNSEELRGL